MSTGSVSSSNSSASQTLYQYYQTLNQSSVTSSSSTQSADTDQDNDSGQSQALQPHHHHHHGGGGGSGGGGGLISQIQQAVTTALDANQSNGSTTDPNQVIQTAIQGVLGGTTSTTGSTSGSSSTDSSSSTGQSFAQLLQSNGVSPQQFEQDLLSALQNSPNAAGPARLAGQRAGLSTRGASGSLRPGGDSLAAVTGESCRR